MELSFQLQAEELGCEVGTESIATRSGNDVLGETNDTAVPEVLQSGTMSCDVLFCKGDVVAVKHARKKEQWGFFLALLNKDLIVKRGSSVDIVSLDQTMDMTWL